MCDFFYLNPQIILPIQLVYTSMPLIFCHEIHRNNTKIYYRFLRDVCDKKRRYERQRKEEASFFSTLYENSRAFASEHVLTLCAIKKFFYHGEREIFQATN